MYKTTILIGNQIHLDQVSSIEETGRRHHSIKKIVKERQTVLLYKDRVEHERDGARTLTGTEILKNEGKSLLTICLGSRSTVHTSNYNAQQ